MDRSAVENDSLTGGPAKPARTFRWRNDARATDGEATEARERSFGREQFHDASFPRVVALLEEPTDARLADITEWVHELGGSLTVANPSLIRVGSRSEILDSFDFCIVDADLLGDVEDSVDYCLRLRNVCPEIPILLLSSEVRSHDLTAERMAICDATLRMPVARSSFFEGVVAAVSNSMFRLQRSKEFRDPRHV